MRLSSLPILFFLASPFIHAQGNYEVQVYGSEMTEVGHTMVELHSNFTFQGSKETINGVRPTEHALHETLEITQGFTKWFETGFYQFTSYRPGEGFQWVGSHIRPRVGVPEDWNWPVGVSLSAEFGYQRHAYSEDTWTLEIRPIIDKQIDRWYFCFNPVFDRAFHGPGVGQGLVFSPNVKIAYDVTKKVTLGMEYYGSTGSIRGFDPISEQQHAVMPSIDLNLSKNWEFNFAAGVGLTGATDHMLVKMILGRRFDFNGKKTGAVH